MINPSSMLTVITEDESSVFVNQSVKAADPVNDTFKLVLGTLSTMYVGYEKPINAVYFSLAGNLNVTGGSIVVEYWDGGAWRNLNPVDGTNFFNRNGLIKWSMPSDWAPLEIEGIEKYYISIYGTASAANVDAQYVGLVFSDDTDIALEFPSLLQSAYYPTGQSNFMSYHLTAKEYIMAEIQRRGYSKIINGAQEPVNQWDVLDIFELKQASLYYAMSQIFFTLSDNSSDNYWQKYLEYKNKYEQAMSLGLLRIDQDNDGQVDPSEKLPIASYRWVR